MSIFIDAQTRVNWPILTFCAAMMTLHAAPLILQNLIRFGEAMSRLEPDFISNVGSCIPGRTSSLWRVLSVWFEPCCLQFQFEIPREYSGRTQATLYDDFIETVAQLLDDQGLSGVPYGSHLNAVSGVFPPNTFFSYSGHIVYRLRSHPRIQPSHHRPGRR